MSSTRVRPRDPNHFSNRALGNNSHVFYKGQLDHEEELSPSPVHGLEDGPPWGVNPKGTTQSALEKFLGISNPFLSCPITKGRADEGSGER